MADVGLYKVDVLVLQQLAESPLCKEPLAGSQRDARLCPGHPLQGIDVLRRDRLLEKGHVPRREHAHQANCLARRQAAVCVHHDLHVRPDCRPQGTQALRDGIEPAPL